MGFISFILGPLLLLVSPNYESVFSDGYKEAITFIEENNRSINNVITDEREKEIIISVIFPELMRYSFLMDYFQEKAMEIIYISHGSEKADFSLGRCQIKPSFVEKMEQFVQCSPSLLAKHRHIIVFSDTSLAEIRSQRIQRIQSFRWQLEYLRCFYSIMNERLAGFKWNSRAAQIRYFATAYNHDFTAGYDEIQRWMKKETFPFGAGSSMNKYSYSNIAVYFYRNNWPDLKNKLFTAGN